MCAKTCRRLIRRESIADVAAFVVRMAVMMGLRTVLSTGDDGVKGGAVDAVTVGTFDLGRRGSASSVAVASSLCPPVLVANAG